MKSKQYVEIDELLKTGYMPDIIYYLFMLSFLNKKVGKQCQKMLIDFALEKEHTNTINLVAGVLRLNASRKTIEEFTNRIIETGILDFMCQLGMLISELSFETQDKLVDAIINSKTKAYHEYKKSGDSNAFVEMLTHTKREYINYFSGISTGLKVSNIDKLGDYFYSSEDLKDICELLMDANLPKDKMLEIEKLILESYDKSQIALFLKYTNNTRLINLIYDDQDLLEEFLKDDKKYNIDIGIHVEKQIPTRGIFGIKRNPKILTKDNVEFPLYISLLKECFTNKYKFVDDNIQRVLNNNVYFKS